jgi:tartrate dehydrogenase/decarboxylase / D-malate dehydrogenase
VNEYHVAAIPGDGIGAEVVPEAVRVIDQLGQRCGFSVRWTEYPWGSDYYREHGEMMPAGGLDLLRRADAILLGAVGDPGVPDHVTLWGLLIPIRRGFGQYVNLRPVRSYAGVRGPLRGDLTATVDLVIVRENNEGEYSEIGGRMFAGTDEEMAVQEAVFTRRGVDRVLAAAFEAAAGRRGVLTSATKSNGIIHTMPFWDERVAAAAARHPGVEVSQAHIDALCARLVLAPAEFDVIVASNLFGDILSDLAAAVVGSIGVAPSGNIDPTRTFPSMFEPVHGSAPDIAGQGVANPVGQLASGAMMLRHLGEEQAAAALERAIATVLDAGAVLTPDLGGTAGTRTVTDAVLGALDEPR